MMTLMLILSGLATDCWTSILTGSDGVVGTLSFLMLNFFYLMIFAKIMSFFVDSLVDDWVEWEGSEAAEYSESTEDVQQSEMPTTEETFSEDPTRSDVFLVTETNTADIGIFFSMFYQDLQYHTINVYNPKTGLDEMYVFNMQTFEYEKQFDDSEETEEQKMEKEELWDFWSSKFITE